MKENIVNENIVDVLVGRYSDLREDIKTTRKISGISPTYYELGCELLGRLLNSVVWLVPEGSNSFVPEEYVIHEGDSLDINTLMQRGYERVERVWNKGEFSVLGDVSVVWPFGMGTLFRISTFGRKIESITMIDPSSRKKIKDLSSVLIPDINTPLYTGNERHSSKGIKLSIVDNGVDISVKEITNLNNVTSEVGRHEIIKGYRSKGYEVWYQTSDLDKYMLSVDPSVRGDIDRVFSNHSGGNFPKGFLSNYAKVLVLTDLEVLGEIDLSIYDHDQKDVDLGTSEILKKVVPGDYIVHEDHGIGIYRSLVQRGPNTYMEIEYAGKDKLFVPLRSSDRLTKYIGSGMRRPKLTGLNSGHWNRTKKIAQDRALDIAKDLLQLYALRESTKGVRVLKDEESIGEFWKFVKEFEFIDTDDQLLATNHILHDFSSEKPMDRLLVGDVGYGKTEIAARAMFAVLNSGYQVAFLAPTTVLVEQHLKVLRERFKGYPFVIESLSRFSSQEQKDSVIEGIGKGGVDLVIGTHSILSKDINFKNLGLLVIDEEQKFGVKQKENIKSKRVETNVLSLTATPIPRTLNMALSGIRDISVLATPPQGRVEIQNSFGQFSWSKVMEAISKELERGGQVYYLHNRVNNIEYVYEKLTNMFPHHRVGIVHGQMDVQQLSKNMISFVNGNTDIIVCTTIIENGLDIPNANTLIIEDATMLGLAQMYQIRGRIGRSSKQAFAYFFFHTLKGDAILRLNALRESQELGSGFLLSNRDLEIRGSGDILGQNQSGTINSVGYGLYTQMLSSAIKKLGK